MTRANTRTVVAAASVRGSRTMTQANARTLWGGGGGGGAQSIEVDGTIRGRQARGTIEVVAHHLGLAERHEEVVGTVEVGHLDVRSAERVGHVGVAARPAGQVELGGEARRPAR